jgi:hypothetical protein
MIIMIGPQGKGRFSHIECDVCEAKAPTGRELVERHTNLMELGWYIAGGMHRCPPHFHHETAARGPQYRDAE